MSNITSIENWGFKQEDIRNPVLDDISLKLLDEELLKKIYLKNIHKDDTKDGKSIATYDIIKISDTRNNLPDIYRIKKTQKFLPSFSKIDKIFKTPTIYRETHFDVTDVKIGHMVTKFGKNGFTQRLGFVDVFCKISITKEWQIKDEGELHSIDFETKQYVMFFKISIAKPSISLVSREIEFFRDALKEIEKLDVIPFYVGYSKIPVSQFQSITVDEILKMEKVHHDC